MGWKIFSAVKIDSDSCALLKFRIYSFEQKDKKQQQSFTLQVLCWMNDDPACRMHFLKSYMELHMQGSQWRRSGQTGIHIVDRHIAGIQIGVGRIVVSIINVDASLTVFLWKSSSWCSEKRDQTVKKLMLSWKTKSIWCRWTYSAELSALGKPIKR